jgi:hypothetical protein
MGHQMTEYVFVRIVDGKWTCSLFVKNKLMGWARKRNHIEHAQSQFFNTLTMVAESPRNHAATIPATG